MKTAENPSLSQTARGSDMKRRTFLRMLGLAPVAAALPAMALPRAEKPVVAEGLFRTVVSEGDGGICFYALQTANIGRPHHRRDTTDTERHRSGHAVRRGEVHGLMPDPIVLAEALLLVLASKPRRATFDRPGIWKYWNSGKFRLLALVAKSSLDPVTFSNNCGEHDLVGKFAGAFCSRDQIFELCNRLRKRWSFNSPTCVRTFSFPV